MMQPTRESTTERLQGVGGPCSAGLGRAVSTIEMGIVRQVVESATEVTVAVELTDPTCPFGLAIADMIQNQLKQGADERRVVVRFEMSDDLWTEDRLDEAAARRLAVIREADHGRV